MTKQIIKTIIKTISVSLNDAEQSKMRSLINLELVGDATVNEYNEDGKMVGKYDDHPNSPQLLQAHYSLARTKLFKAKFNVMIDGTLEFVEVV